MRKAIEGKFAWVVTVQPRELSAHSTVSDACYLRHDGCIEVALFLGLLPTSFGRYRFKNSCIPRLTPYWSPQVKGKKTEVMRQCIRPPYGSDSPGTGGYPYSTYTPNRYPKVTHTRMERGSNAAAVRKRQCKVSSPASRVASAGCVFAIGEVYRARRASRSLQVLAKVACPSVARSVAQRRVTGMQLLNSNTQSTCGCWEKCL